MLKFAFSQTFIIILNCRYVLIIYRYVLFNMSDDVLIVMIKIQLTRFFNQACNVIIGEVKNSKLKEICLKLLKSHHYI